jgi:hypothetical protein
MFCTAIAFPGRAGRHRSRPASERQLIIDVSIDISNIYTTTHVTMHALHLVYFKVFQSIHSILISHTSYLINIYYFENYLLLIDELINLITIQRICQFCLNNFSENKSWGLN